MVELSYTHPGFPVYRALTVPIPYNGKFEKILKVDEDVVKSWRELLRGLRQYISKYHTIINNLKNKPIGHEYYETLADIIALYFRQPLQLDPIPSAMISPLKLYSETRKIRFIYEVYEDDPINTLNKLIEINKSPEITSREDIDNLVKCWLRLPADTRPGHNTSGLIPHLLTTSAIAWALAIEENLGRMEASKVRLAAMLHDMSKPFDYRKHWKITDTVVDQVFDREVLGSDFVDELAQLVREHHIRSGDVLGDIIHRADIDASSLDRMRRFVKEILRKELGDRFDTLFGAGEEAWNEWERLERESPGKIMELSKKFVEEMAKVKELDGEVLEKEKLLYFLVDIGGIQEFIYRTVDLRTVAASSYVVDFLLSAYLLMSIQHHLEAKRDVWFPVEAFMINGGGNLSFIAPASLRDAVIECLEGIRNILEAKLGLRLYFGYSNLTDSFAETGAKAAAMVGLQKIKHDKPAEYKTISPNLCNYCYTNPIEIMDKKACQTCGGLHDIGSEFHFRKKWSAKLVLLPETIEIGGVEAAYDPKMDFMIMIAGHSPSELADVQKGVRRKRNVAVVKFDANMMGKFFAQSISLTDALERSWRVDMSMKMAYQKTLCEMYKAVTDCIGGNKADLAVRQCYLGTLYMGGDDGLIICPSWASIPLSIGISKYFHNEMGQALTLGVGLAVTTPEHDVWSSIEAASELLKMAKKAGRKITPPSDSYGAICFDIIEAGTLSKSAVKSRHYELVKEKLTAQPFMLGGSERLRRFDTILEKLLETQTSDLHDLFAKCWAVSRSREVENEHQRTLKKVRSALKEPPEITRTSNELAIKLSFTYFNRQIARLGKEEEQKPEKKEDPTVMAYKMVVNALREYLGTDRCDELLTPWADIDRLIKIVGGGVL